MSRDIRWLQRFDNFSKACARLLTITDTMEYDALSELEKEGLIQRFEYTFELAWKVLQDYMQYLGFQFQTGPNTTLQLAFENGLIKDHDRWRKMAKARILTSHTYNEGEEDEIAKGIYADYAPLLRELRDLLIIRKNETENKDLF